MHNFMYNKLLQKFLNLLVFLHLKTKSKLKKKKKSVDCRKNISQIAMLPILLLYLHMHAKPSIAHRLQTAKIAYSRTVVCKIMALRRKVFYQSIKCFNHGLRAFNGNGDVQSRLATQTVTMLTPGWQVLSEVELRRIFDVWRPRCKRWVNSGFECIY